MMDKLKLERARAWPESDQAELAEYAEQIERRHAGDYRATPDELAAIDEADRSGVAAEKKLKRRSEFSAAREDRIFESRHSRSPQSLLSRPR